MNFFAGPTDMDLRASVNFYDVHYAAHHYVGTTGGSTEDMLEALTMIAEKRLKPSGLITHVGGLDAVVDTVLNLPKIPGGKKLIYTHVQMPLTTIDEFAQKGETEPLFSKLAEICNNNNGLWCGEAEDFLLSHAKEI